MAKLKRLKGMKKFAHKSRAKNFTLPLIIKNVSDANPIIKIGLCSDAYKTDSVVDG